jgi:hypothetical protein
MGQLFLYPYSVQRIFSWFLSDFAAEIWVRDYPRLADKKLFMPDAIGRRGPSVLSAETKWEMFLPVAAGEMTQAEAARKWRVDMSTVMAIRRTVTDAALAAVRR